MEGVKTPALVSASSGAPTRPAARRMSIGIRSRASARSPAPSQLTSLGPGLTGNGQLLDALEMAPVLADPSALTQLLVSPPAD